MGYECPVCATEEADGEHLANHLAFTALVRGGDHEAWLDDHVPDWADRDPESLAPEVTPHATETETEPSTEPHGHGHEMPSVERTGQADISGEAAEILEEAQELTEEMRREDERSESSEGASGERERTASREDADGDDAEGDASADDAANSENE